MTCLACTGDVEPNIFMAGLKSSPSTVGLQEFRNSMVAGWVKKTKGGSC